LRDAWLGFADGRWGTRCGGATSLRRDQIFLAKPFINETEGLPDRFQMEIEENVNPGGQEGWFSKIPFQNGKKYGISNNCL
jgi:hypothetical protein